MKPGKRFFGENQSQSTAVCLSGHWRRRAGLAGLAAVLIAAAPPAPVAVTGRVAHPQSLTLDQIKALPARHVEADFATMHGQDHHSWTGVLLWDLVTKASPQDEPGRRTGMRHVIMVSGQDGYAAAVAIGEIDPAIGGKQVILAYRQDDPPMELPTLRLIVPGDKHGARDVHDVSGIEVR